LSENFSVIVAFPPEMARCGFVGSLLLARNLGRTDYCQVRGLGNMNSKEMIAATVLPYLIPQSEKIARHWQSR
jgi:hypothetical protein